MKQLMVGLLSLISVVSCQKAISPNEDVISLHERFHGKYKPVSSVASEAVDVNLDGKSSTDLLAEITDLPTTFLQIDIYGPSQYRAERSFSFYHTWPEQYVRIPSTGQEPAAYDEAASVNYARQGATRPVEFDKTLRQLQVLPDWEKPADPDRFALPEAVTVEADNYLKVVTRKRLYTRSGWKTVRIETLYQRYTTST